jgi:hypothetical protein
VSSHEEVSIVTLRNFTRDLSATLASEAPGLIGIILVCETFPASAKSFFSFKQSDPQLHMQPLLRCWGERFCEAMINNDVTTDGGNVPL